ncbi:MAG: helix-turn-helix domain-containing protein [Clostridia bacterium]|nr:helix-turn-helix domain-containing protein [Clostridia bacterium]
MRLRYDFSPRDSVTPPRHIRIGCSADPRVTRYGPSHRNMYLIHYVTAGKGYFNGNSVKAGQGFLITPGMAEHYYPDEKAPWTYLWIITTDPAIEYFFEQHAADPESGIFQYRNVGVVESIMKRLMTETSPFRFSAMQTLEYFLNIFNHCVYTPPKNKTSNEKLYFDYAVEYISAALSSPIMVEELCQRLGVSQAYLYKVFKNNVAISPKQYILQSKLLQAQLLLKESDLSISEVGDAVGFSDVLAFSRFFSSRTGCSPTDYRKGI